MKLQSFLLITLILLASACSQRPQATIVIIPDKCKIGAGEDFPISLQGSNMPASGKITWSATKGEIHPPSGLNVIYTAPQQSGSVVITAVLEADGLQTSSALTCEITAPEPTASPTETPLPTLAPVAVGDTIAITEVMSTPCDSPTSGGRGPNRNEYIELYNYGTADVDVSGWWIATTGGGGGTPDQIVPWNSANPGADLGNSVSLNESVIPPGGFAVILSPLYTTGAGAYYMPYTFPEGTIILSFKTSNYLGNDSTGLVGITENMPLTVIVLYKGSDSLISKVVSTYGTPDFGSSPGNVKDDHGDLFPYPLTACRAMERIVASGADTISNWHDIDKGNPGQGNYDGN